MSMRRLGLLLIVACLRLPLARADEPPQPPPEPAVVDLVQLVQDAVAGYGDGDNARAAELLERAYALRADARVLFNLARAYERGGRREQALDCYRRYLAQPEVEPALARQAREA